MGYSTVNTHFVPTKIKNPRSQWQYHLVYYNATSLKVCVSQSGIHHYEAPYVAVKATYATLRHLPHIVRFSIQVSTSHMGSWHGSTRVWEFQPCLPSPSIFSIYTPPFHHFKGPRILAKKPSRNYSWFTPEPFGYISFLRDWLFFLSSRTKKTNFFLKRLNISFPFPKHSSQSNNEVGINKQPRVHLWKTFLQLGSQEGEKWIFLIVYFLHLEFFLFYLSSISAKWWFNCLFFIVVNSKFHFPRLI